MCIRDRYMGPKISFGGCPIIPVGFTPSDNVNEKILFDCFNRQNIIRFAQSIYDDSEEYQMSNLGGGGNIRNHEEQKGSKVDSVPANGDRAGGRDAARRLITDPYTISPPHFTSALLHTVHPTSTLQPIHAFPFLLPPNVGIETIGFAIAVQGSPPSDLNDYQCECQEEGRCGERSEFGGGKPDEKQKRDAPRGNQIEKVKELQAEPLQKFSNPFSIQENGRDSGKMVVPMGGEGRKSRVIGEARREKLRRYFEKRAKRCWTKKISYGCRRQVAQKRLRIKGRFVTKEQAIATLGVSAVELSKNESLRTMVASKNCSIVALVKNVKIRNIQNLVNMSKKEVAEIKRKLKKEECSENSLPNKTQIVESNTPKNFNGGVIEIKIDELFKKDTAKILQEKN
eukprot:TRINITY_DN10316_c0_g2_i3.p1 TRINITY_DN10316_c0_g2~~TRINITY_DN10316_c0_g2_i3.p1  ORF type:complete len:398 (-),score=67.64 TRINITY_DN10316_c0_g2_i3:102-1295(-)